MGSCFRWKKKNSYTVTHDEEYSVSGGKYNPNREPYVAKNKPEIPAASNSAAKKWAAESRSDVETNQNVSETNDKAPVSVPIANDHEDRNVNEYEDIKENGYHREDESHTFPSIPEDHDEKKSDFEDRDSHKQEEVDISYQQHEVVTDANDKIKEDTFSPDVRADSPLTVEAGFGDVRSESPQVVPEVIAEIASDSARGIVTYEDVSSVPSTEERIAAVQTYANDGDSSEDDREDLVQVREEYLLQKRLDEETRKNTGDEELAEYRPSPDTDVINELDQVHITDSPAGTWDARLNKDVCAEMEEQQQLSLGDSKSNSEASLDLGYRRQDDPDQTNDDNPIVQRVQFDLPAADYQRDSDVINVVTVGEDTYVVDQDGELRYGGNETYSSPDGAKQIEEQLDNDINTRLATGSGQGYPEGSLGQYDEGDRLRTDDGIIELSEGIAVSYEDPYSSSGQVNVVVSGNSP